MEQDKQIEMLNDVRGEGCSSCCSASVYSPTPEWAQCMDCYEYCDIVTDEE